MKAKILESLKTKYKNLGFSDKTFNGVADFLSKTVTDEASIETAISGVEELLKTFQGESDRLRNELAELKKSKPKEKTEDTSTATPDPSSDDKPLTKKELLEILREKEQALSDEKSFEAKKSAALQNLKEKGVKEKTAVKILSRVTDKNMSIEDIQSFVQKEYDEIYSDIAPEAGRPSGSGLGGGSSSSEINDYLAAKRQEIQKQTNKKS